MLFVGSKNCFIYTFNLKFLTAKIARDTTSNGFCFKLKCDIKVYVSKLRFSLRQSYFMSHLFLGAYVEFMITSILQRKPNSLMNVTRWLIINIYAY